MAVYVDLTYYKNTYLGTAIADADFPRLALRASITLDMIAYDRVAPIITDATDTATIDKIKMACCAMAEEQQNIEQNGGDDGIVSEGIGSNNVSYNAGSVKQQTNLSKMTRAAKLYLRNTFLLFPGFAKGEESRFAD